MSFWQDLEEMQKEIENLDTRSASRTNSKGNSKDERSRKSQSNSIQRARISELEDKAKSLSKMIAKQNKKTTTKTSIQSPTYSKNMELCVKDAAKSHDANVQLMHHLAALEKEIQNLTQKEDVWHDTAKIIQEEVQSLREQINLMKSQQKSISNTRSNTRSVTYSKDTRDSRNNLRKRQNRRKSRDDRSRIQTITQRTERTEYTERERERERDRGTTRDDAVQTSRISLDRRMMDDRSRVPPITQRTERTERTEYTQRARERERGPIRDDIVVQTSQISFDRISQKRPEPEPMETRSEFQTNTVIKETRTQRDNNINVYQYQRLERVNKQLSSDYERLQKEYQQSIDKFTTEKQQLNAKIAAKDTEIDKLQHNLQNAEYRAREERTNCTDLQQQIVVLQQVVDDYDHLKEANGKLQLEYQRSLQDILEARKERSIMDQKLNAAKNQIQELEIKMRQCNHEKMGSVSEMRAMKNVFGQEKKSLIERYERTIQKLEAELSYAKKIYQEIKRKYRELQTKFEQDQPCYQKLKEQLESERDAFQAKLNDVVIGHVSNLDLISKQSNVAIENSKWVAKDDAITMDNNQTETSQMITTNMDTPSQNRRMTAIWEPNQ